MEPVGRSEITFRLLGAVEARRGDIVVPLGGPRQRALLALLLLHGPRPVNIDLLIEEIWAGEPPDGAETTLRSYVSRLRAALSDAVPITRWPGGYSIDVEDDAVDLRHFERLVRDGEKAAGARAWRRARDRLGAALALWTGPPFAGLSPDGVLRIEAGRLEGLRLLALEWRLEADLELGGHDAVIPELEELVQEHPFRERLWAQLMLALYRAGRQADALAAYRRARRQLGDQLGLDPGEELERLQQQILRQEVPPSRPPESRHNLPVLLTSFIGRTSELVEVAELLDRSRLLTLVGVGGVGKTRLALEAARARVADHPDGVTFVDLAPIADPDHLAAHVATTLEIREQAGAAGVDRLSAHLRRADGLIVLDNCEHLRAACADLVARLLWSCPDLRILATSREVLGVPGEVDYPVPPLGLPADVGAQAAARDSEAVRLFLARARAARPEFPDDDETVETVARICADLDGLPLGIELAAARARALSPAEIGARIRDRFRFLVSWRRVAAARHRTLREAMDWSYGLLEPDEQRVLRSLSVFAGGFTLAAVAAVATDGDEEQALLHLERLVEASLVVVDTLREPTRYRLLETVRHYGAEQLDRAGETVAARRRHAEHFTAVAEAAWHPLRSQGVWVQAEWVDRLTRDSENLRAALAWQLESGDFDALLRMAESLWWSWWIRGELSEGRQWLAAALAQPRPADTNLRASAHLGLAGLSWAQGDLDTAEEHATAARQLFAEVGNGLQEGSALNTLGLVADGRHQFREARALFEAALAKFREQPDSETVRVARNTAVTIDNLGSVSHELGEDETALAQYREALALNRARDDAEGVAMNELHIAIIEAEAGHLAEARSLLASSLAVYRNVGFHQYAAECLEAASIVANGTGSPDVAAFLLGASSGLRDESGLPPVPILARIRERETALAREALGDERFERLSDRARQLPPDTALQEALAYLG